MKNLVLIVGMARSGTTVAQHILGLQAGTRTEVEPHMLWKTGNFGYLSDEQCDVSEAICCRIRARLTCDLGDRTLVEKSPANSLRPALVHSTFPDARVIYMIRDPASCIASNLLRSETRDSLRPSIVLRKYLRGSGSQDLAGALGKRTLLRQLGPRDMAPFVWYTFRMLWLRQVNRTLPFGPKIEGFSSLVRRRGLLGYHVEVYRRTRHYRDEFQKLYGGQMRSFRLEDVHHSEATVRELIEFACPDQPVGNVAHAMATYAAERVSAAGHADRRDAVLKALEDNGMPVTWGATGCGEAKR